MTLEPVGKRGDSSLEGAGRARTTAVKRVRVVRNGMEIGRCIVD